MGQERDLYIMTSESHPRESHLATFSSTESEAPLRQVQSLTELPVSKQEQTLKMRRCWREVFNMRIREQNGRKKELSKGQDQKTLESL